MRVVGARPWSHAEGRMTKGRARMLALAGVLLLLGALGHLELS